MAFLKKAFFSVIFFPIRNDWTQGTCAMSPQADDGSTDMLHIIADRIWMWHSVINKVREKSGRKLSSPCSSSLKENSPFA